MRALLMTAYFAVLLLLLAFAGARRVGPQAESPAAASCESAVAPIQAASGPGADVAPSAPPESPQARRHLVAHHDGCDMGPCESATGVGLKSILRAQNPDGSWGGDAESFEGRIHTQATATSLSLLALFAAGYTHLTRETTKDGLCFGTAIKGGLKWLRDCEPSDAYESSLVALALSEAYGLTGSQLIKPMAQDSLDRLADWQRYDATRTDPVAEAWAAAAVASGKIGELEYDAEAADRARARLDGKLDTSPDAATAAAWILLTKDHDHPALAPASIDIAASLPDWENPDFTGWYFGTLALHQIEGVPSDDRRGQNWKAWAEALKGALVAHQERDGTWPGVSGVTGTAVRNALGTLALEVYYRYASAIGVK
jgi:hypothetical protein